jgi:hypothetical protein
VPRLVLARIDEFAKKKGQQRLSCHLHRQHSADIQVGAGLTVMSLSRQFSVTLLGPVVRGSRSFA